MMVRFAHLSNYYDLGAGFNVPIALLRICIVGPLRHKEARKGVNHILTSALLLKNSTILNESFHLLLFWLEEGVEAMKASKFRVAQRRLLLSKVMRVRRLRRFAVSLG